MSTELAEVVSAVQARVSYLRCHEDAPPADGWISCAALIASPERLGAEIGATAPGRGTKDPQVAASLYTQAYAFRVPSIAVAAFALGLPVPQTSPEVTAIRISRHRPADLAILTPRCREIPAPALAQELLEGHLGRFVLAVRAVTRVGERLLWGNVAASLATIFRAVQSNGPLGDPAVRARAAEFERAASPWLDGLGHYSSLEAPPALGWYWNRTSCCLWYQTTSGSYCEDCSLHDPADLAARRLSAIHGGTSA